ncbi:MAG: pyruvate kinase [Candidatus Omnitrophota bacterium]
MNIETKIICTIGPASRDKEKIIKMSKAGMSVARLNFSHGSIEDHQKTFDFIKAVNKQFNFDIKTLLDLEGYRVRVGRLKQPIMLKEKQKIWLGSDSKESASNIPLDSDIEISAISKGMEVFINDGLVALKVIACSKKKVQLEVVHGGLISSKKGINIPGLRLKTNILTDKDKKDIEVGILNKVDYIAQSFVRSSRDILRVAKKVKPHLPDCKIIAKIENRDGVKNIDGIIDACDGIMVARGDLGVTLPIYKIPFIQKYIIRRANRMKRFVVTATQMLESMTEHPRPTRAEVSDVANAVLDGTDFVMLSAETAVGKFPVEAVNMMSQIISFTEKTQRLKY